MTKKARSTRDDFTKPVVESMARQVGFVCSNPDCSIQTLGPSSKPNASSSIGVAAHICAASPGGKRYDPTQTVEERTSADNGIWLCNNCSRAIDNDDVFYSKALLHAWKANAIAIATRRLGRRVLKDADVEARIKSAFRALPTSQSQHAISNVHQATRQYLHELDPRLDVTTSYRDGTTSYQIRAVEDVSAQITWTANDPEKVMSDFRATLETGCTAALDLTSIVFTGSPVFAELMNDKGPGRLLITPNGTPATVRILARGEDGDFEAAQSVGELVRGTKGGSATASFFGGRLKLRLMSNIDTAQESGVQLDISLTYETWDGVDIRVLPDFEQLARLVRALKKHPTFQLEIFRNTGEVLQQSVDIAAYEEFVESHLNWLNYISMARKLVHTYKLMLPFRLAHPPSREDYLELFDCVETLEGRKTSQHTKIAPLNFSLTMSKEQVLPGGVVNLEIEYRSTKLPTYQVFGSTVTLPTHVFYARSKGHVSRPGNYKIGDKVEVTLSMGADCEFRMYFADSPPATIQLAET